MYNATEGKYKYIISANQVNYIFYVNIFQIIFKLNREPNNPLPSV